MLLAYVVFENVLMGALHASIMSGCMLAFQMSLRGLYQLEEWASKARTKRNFGNLTSKWLASGDHSIDVLRKY